MINRIDVEFMSDGLKCRAWLYMPEEVEKPPVVVMAHGLGGTKNMRLDAFAERFCSEGYAALVFDYRHFGTSEGEPRQLLDIQCQLRDWEAALRFVRSRSDVDTHRVVIWGTSFGGGHVLMTAANDQNIKAVISQCPFTDGLSSALAMDLKTSFKVTGLAIMDKIGSLLCLPPLMVKLAGKPGTAALMTAPDAEPGYLALVPDKLNSRNEVAARVALDIPWYYPGKKASGIGCPVLICVCDKDSVAPSKATLRHARKALQGEIKVYSDGHFDIYINDGFERVVADQIEFLKRHVPVL